MNGMNKMNEMNKWTIDWMNEWMEMNLKNE